ncbi:MAG: C25 family cysteine peptidase [bacterium]
MKTKKLFFYMIIIFFTITIIPNISFALIARTHLGPGLAYYSGRETWTFLLFKGHNNDYIWEGRYKGGAWEGLGQVHDQDSTSWAFTDHEPVAFTYHLHAIETGLMPRGSRWWLYLVFNGHNNDYVWYTRKEINEAYASVYMGNWETPRLIAGTDTDLSPGAAMHDWGAGDEVLTIGYTGDDGRINLKRAAYDFNHQTPYEWQSVTSLPSTAKSSDGPALISYNGKLYVFYRGAGTNYKIYYAVARNSNPANPDWEIFQIPYAYSTHTPSVTEYKGDLIVTFKGHNNQYIWIRRYDNETGEWQNMGYVKDLKTDQRPDIESTGNYLTLAFRPPNYANTNLCIGSLILDENLRGDRPGHNWYKTTGSLCCPADGLAVYDLLIITPSEFVAGLQPLVDHKNATGCPTLMVNLESIYSNPHFDGHDEPEEIKKAIEYYEKNFAIKYVMLVGDSDKFPVRWVPNTFDPRAIGDYHVSDLYYADLYTSGDHEQFNQWDFDEDGYFGELRESSNFKNDPYSVNLDHMDLYPDVAVGRIPASNSDEVENYVTKVIRYEYLTHDSDNDWFHNIVLMGLHGHGNACHPGIYFTDIKNYLGNGFDYKIYMERFFYEPVDRDNSRPPCICIDDDSSLADCDERTGITSIQREIFMDNDGIIQGDNLPNGVLNDVGFVARYGHGSSNIVGNYSGIQNYNKFTIGISTGCEDGVFVNPQVGVPNQPIPSPIQPNTIDRNPENKLFAKNSATQEQTGWIGFVGATRGTNFPTNGAIMSLFFKGYLDPHPPVYSSKRTLGDMWRSMLEYWLEDWVLDEEGSFTLTDFVDRFQMEDYYDDGGVACDCIKHTMIYALFGDPSLRVGGISGLRDDLAPITSIDTTEWPKVRFIASDYGAIPSRVRKINYRVNGGTWQNDDEVILGDGRYVLEYYSEDFVGNEEVHNVKVFLPFEMTIPSGWSMISLPLKPGNASVSFLFPEASVVYDYKQGLGYERITGELEAGKGYWILMNEGRTYNLHGEAIYEHSHLIQNNGWYIIGGCTEQAQVSLNFGTITTIYEYNQSYGYQRITEADRLSPAKGYWVLITDTPLTVQAVLTVKAEF